ncbi:hypothetical protein O181_027682 [Austropuccinia psidii MF-1]|uniref:CCHC-type domain-containing protein n=1 Tax=Austropuccinia psidii MF-1 TaxID=1389203 RepID=A0A9Q3CT38_9BASI|nr:hypothetical protein [Austropuccinia psidii MF-1]
MRNDGARLWDSLDHKKPFLLHYHYIICYHLFCNSLLKYTHILSPSTRSEAWATQWLSPKHPCVHCWEWGHWAQDCPRKRAGKPAAEDPGIKQPDFKLRKSQHVSHPALAGMEVNDQCNGDVAAIAKPPANDALVLLYSGATHHVTNN